MEGPPHLLLEAWGPELRRQECASCEIECDFAARTIHNSADVRILRTVGSRRVVTNVICDAGCPS